MRAITDFCLMAQYCSHTSQTIGYMNEYLRQFDQHMHIFSEFRASKADHQEAAKVSQGLAEGQTQQATIHQYFQITPTQLAKRSAKDREVRQQAAHSILQQATFNFPKLHLLSHYSSQIVDFGTLPQYSTEVTEALHKPLKDAYRRSNRVDAAEQILDTINREYAIQLRGLNLIAWSEDIQLPPEVLEILDITKDSPSTTRQRATIIRRPTLGDKQSTDNPSGDCLLSLAVTLGIPSLRERFLNYLKLNAPRVEPPLALSEISQYRAHHYASLSVPVIQFQGDEKLNHRVRWTGQRSFRQRGENKADWVWVHMR